VPDRSDVLRMAIDLQTADIRQSSDAIVAYPMSDQVAVGTRIGNNNRRSMA
jgi:hypothetical protein